MRKVCLCFILAFLCVNISKAQENLIINPGFEESGTNGQPTGDWWPFEGRGKTTVTVDHEVAHSGKASLRLHGDPNAKFTFVSPKFEVAPGDELHFEVWVRAQDLPTKGSAVTAGLAFRRRDGTVMQRDYFHLEAPGENWSRIAGDARAPSEAVSAEAHLGYTNGPGTVWYDDVSAEITNPYSLALVGGPKLSLTIMPGAKEWTNIQVLPVKASTRQQKAFRGAVKCETGGHFSTVKVFIRPGNDGYVFNMPVLHAGIGRHHYKLSLLDASNAPVHSVEGDFVVAAPIVLFPACPCFHIVGQGDGTMRVNARLNIDSGVSLGASVQFELSDSAGKSIQKTRLDATARDVVGCELKVPVGQKGVYQITAKLLDRDDKELHWHRSSLFNIKPRDEPAHNGQVLASDTTEVRVVAQDDSKVTVGPDGFLRIGGQSNFPIGLYNCGRFEEMGKAGFSATHEYGITTGEADEPINPNEKQVQKLLDQSWSNGLRVMIELPRKAIEKARWDQVRRRIETFRNHPGLLCWGSEERVARGLAPLSNIAALYKLANELDPNHPLVLGDTRDVIQNLQGDRRNFFPDPYMDIGIWWWYPIPLKEPDGNGLEGGANAGKLLEPPSWLTTTLSKKPLWIAIQSYQKPSKDARFPTPAEYRAQAYLSIIAGVKGLFLYVGYGQKDFQGKPAGLLNKPVEAHWDYVQKLARELHEFSPVIMSPPASGEVKLLPANAPIQFTTRESDGKIYLIAASESPQAQQARFESTLFEGRMPRVLYEEHPATVAGNSLSDEFEPFAVHIYELSQTK